MLEQEVRSLDEVDLPIRSDKVVADCLNVVKDDQLQPVRLHSLAQVQEHFVVFFE